MFEATRPFLFFDYFRIPYEIEDGVPLQLTDLGPGHPLRACGRIRSGADEPPRDLFWPVFDALPVSHSAYAPAAATFDEIPIYGRLIDDAAAAGWLSATGDTWKPETAILGSDSERLGSVWRDANGSAFLPFDPAEVIANYWSEEYQTIAGGGLSSSAKAVARRWYYRARPFIPRPLQIWLRRRFSTIQARTRFPAWPVEPALHDLFDVMLALVAELARRPVPWLSPWPDGYSWALVITHDVESALGCESVPLMRDVERSLGYRSSWNFVPERYDVDEQLLRDLDEDGFEIGVHGLRHDGRDLESLEALTERLPAIRQFGERWGAAGFRSPATQRGWELMPHLGFEYDSSYPDTDPFEPQGGGCCTWWPFFNRTLVELPITLTQDHTLFVILGRRDESLWLEKTEYLKERGGMAVLLTHPDYMRDGELIGLYTRYLETYESDPTAWRALPREVAAWWRRRGASQPELVDGSWQVTGPAAAEARVCFTTPGRSGLPEPAGART